MAFYVKVLCFSLLLFCFSSVHIHARENNFFSKVSPYKTNKDNALLPKEVLTSKQESEPEPTFTPENSNGYGLYGSEIDQGARYSNSPQKTYNELDNGGQNTKYVFNNGNPFARNNKENTGYRNVNYGGYDDSKHNNLYGNNELNNYNKNLNRVPVQQQGMSDTRFLENCKYFYDVNNEELYKNRYHNQRRRNDVFGASGYQGANTRDQYNQEGIDDNLYRFNNFMENSHKGNKEEYVP